ncbi:MAG TPA: M4 family metallopeptidase [Mycobacteriales bacterium]|nr:M4 family metallopeptidase [Mycobacteriales bacterium]
MVAARPAQLHAAVGDSFAASPVIQSKQGLQYVPYQRTYQGLRTYGGDFVVVTNSSGQVLSTEVAQTRTIALSTLTPAVSAAAASATARAQSKATTVDGVKSIEKMVYALDTPRLAYEAVVAGHSGQVPSALHVFVDAMTGKVIYSYDQVADGTGNGAIYGAVSIATSGAGTSFSMTDPTRPGIACRNFTTGAVMTGTDDVWGNGVGTNLETGCVDALFTVQREWDMFGALFGRNGITGTGRGFPLDVGLNDLNAFWDGSRVAVGHNQAGAWIGSFDVVGHEFGHALDSNTPGGQSGNGVSEATGDVMGTSVEFFANNPNDPPDYSIGEEINLVGSGPIRQMYNPSLVGDPNCYSASIPTAETHAAAGPFDHWFALASKGSAAAGGQPASPTCNGSVVTGIGEQVAANIFYNAMLSKTAGMTYLRYRTATLNAAKNLTPGNCTNFNTIKAAWDAVSVPAQAADPTCAVGGAVTVTNPGAKSGTAGTAITPFTLTASPAGTYTWSASGLPTGLTIGATTGTVSGTPTAAGTFTVTATATSAAGSGSTSFTFTIAGVGGACASPGQKFGNPGFETASAPWTATAGVIGANTGTGAPRTGTRDAWLDGYGTTHTDTLSQTVTIPAGCTASTLTFFLKIVSSETTTTTAFDTLSVRVGTTTVGTFSNLNKGTTYVARSFPVGSFAGQSVAVTFTGTEDASLQTSFVIDDTGLNAA